MERTIHAPDADLLTEAEAAAWLRLQLDDFREFVRMGILPAGIPYKKQPSKHVWPWLDVIAVAHLLGRGFIQLPDGVDPEAGEKLPKTPKSG